MKERENLHPEKVDDGRQCRSPASYTLNKEEKESIFECLHNIKVPSTEVLSATLLTKKRRKAYLNA
jgi:hypothetical protein